MNRHLQKRFWLGFAAWSVVGSLAAACGSSSRVLVPSSDGGEGGQAGGETSTGGTLEVGGAGKGGSNSPSSAAGQANGNDAGASDEGGSAGQAGSSSEAGAAGDDNRCGGCCTIADCPGAGYACTDHECVNVAGSLSGLLWQLPCTGAPVDAASCPTDPTVTVNGTLGGATGVTYDVTLHFRGVVEPKSYQGGCSDGAFWQSGGADNGDVANVYELRVSNPPQDYFLNVGSSAQKNTIAIDYVKTVRIDAGATVTLFVASIDSLELFNHDASSTPITIPGTSVTQPFDGQFIQMDVESVTPSAIASNAVIGGGTSGSALSFAGAQLATVADSTPLHSTSVTQEAWFKFNGASGGYNAMLGKPEGADIDDSYTLWAESGTLRGYVGTPNSAYISQPFSDVTQWHHAAFTYDLQTSIQTLYLDGAVVACAPATGAIAYDTHALEIGADLDHGALSGFWNGTLDEVRVFSTARSADQIWADLHTHKLGPTAGLVGEWTFDEGSGQTTADSSGNALSAVLGSNSTVEASDPVWVNGR